MTRPVESILKVSIPGRELVDFEPGETRRRIAALVGAAFPNSKVLMLDGAKVVVPDSMRPVVELPHSKCPSIWLCAGTESDRVTARRVLGRGKVLLNRVDEKEALKQLGRREFLKDSLFRMLQADQVIALPGWDRHRAFSLQVWIASLIGIPVEIYIPADKERG